MSACQPSQSAAALATIGGSYRQILPRYSLPTFYLADGGLFLHAASATPQQAWAVCDWMGQGQVGYTTGAQPMPRNGERATFKLDEFNNLSFHNVTFCACPGEADGA
ncbi:hypothetical protein GGTG_12647 [Gaeumannomyces tritici R3-111a-1]|uniref:Uncharacterized protein n=1 Tax=Gaeumannomyces tritici (strain R3-111a-1) TaxID=644352 RepID=J3PGL8_GAET3|nr:hypothetical protein GGTG_12647 [Gaeumannomyces tritici R3-111a-1]EJT69764.1 hypothetical protein GGTG_12647 [Gaeumannomyces tritici R3-111a-1]